MVNRTSEAVESRYYVYICTCIYIIADIINLTKRIHVNDIIVN